MCDKNVECQSPECDKNVEYRPPKYVMPKFEVIGKPVEEKCIATNDIFNGYVDCGGYIHYTRDSVDKCAGIENVPIKGNDCEVKSAPMNEPIVDKPVLKSHIRLRSGKVKKVKKKDIYKYIIKLYRTDMFKVPFLYDEREVADALKTTKAFSVGRMNSDVVPDICNCLVERYNIYFTTQERSSDYTLNEFLRLVKRKIKTGRKTTLGRV